MLTFTNPSALLALLGLLVPLAIHLWNRRPGREVAMGSLRWLTAGANRRLRNLRLEQLWLLLLRAALLAVLAGAVAGPVWRHLRPAGRGQVLVSPELVGKNVLAAVRPRIDSLRRRGYTLRWLSQRLPLLPAAAWRADSLVQPLPFDVVTMMPKSDDFYEARIRQAADTFAGQPLYVLTSARLAAMRGIHRPLPAQVTWQTLPLPAENTWLQAATSTADSLHLLLGHSNERQTTFNTVRMARPQSSQSVVVPGQPSLRYQLINNELKPLQTDSSQAQSSVPVQRAALRVWVYAPPAYAAEARYLRAALRAASVGLPGPLALTVAPTLPPATAADWLFWLPATPVPTTWREQVRQGLHLWQAPPGPGTADTTFLITAGLATETPATIWQRVSLPSSANIDALWTDGQGRPVLTRQALGQGASYHFASRLNPAWSTLADNPALPALLLNVLQPAPAGAALMRLRTHDQRRLDATQFSVSERRVGSVLVPPTFRLLDLRPWLVLLAGALLALERWLAIRRGAASSLLPA